MSSLKCWLKKIEKQDRITPEELAEIMGMLDGHDDVVRADERAKTIDEFLQRIEQLNVFYDNDRFSSNEDAMWKCEEVTDVLMKMKGDNNG